MGEQIREFLPAGVVAQDVVFVFGYAGEAQPYHSACQEIVYLRGEVVLCRSQDIAEEGYKVRCGVGIAVGRAGVELVQHFLRRYALEHHFDEVERGVDVARVGDEFGDVVHKMHQQLLVPVLDSPG